MIYFIRHGQTDYNVRKICTGHQDIPLNATGLQQAKNVALQLKGVKFEACYCSPLLRAKQTCTEILRYHPGLEAIYDDRIKERACGQAENKSRDVISFSNWKLGEHEDEAKALGIETIASVLKRVSDFYDEMKKYQGQNILVVAHAGIGKVSHVYFNGMPEDQMIGNIKIPNAEVITFLN